VGKVGRALVGEGQNQAPRAEEDLHLSLAHVNLASGARKQSPSPARSTELPSLRRGAKRSSASLATTTWESEHGSG